MFNKPETSAFHSCSFHTYNGGERPCIRMQKCVYSTVLEWCTFGALPRKTVKPSRNPKPFTLHLLFSFQRGHGGWNANTFKAKNIKRIIKDPKIIPKVNFEAFQACGVVAIQWDMSCCLSRPATACDCFDVFDLVCCAGVGYLTNACPHQVCVDIRSVSGSLICPFGSVYTGKFIYGLHSFPACFALGMNSLAESMGSQNHSRTCN